nr:helicase associated domain-containing protein [uncultured Prevotella sp.]
MPSFLKLTDQEKHAFDRLLQSTKQYRNENIINHVSRLTEGVPNQKGRNEVLNADNGTEVHVGAWERRWFEMRDRYSKYLDDNKKVPTDNSDLQLYQWLLRQRKLLAAGSLKESRKAELEKLLKRGLMKAERIAKFKQLLSEAENLPRINQFNYVDTSLKS